MDLLEVEAGMEGVLLERTMASRACRWTCAGRAANISLKRLEM